MKPDDKGNKFDDISSQNSYMVRQSDSSFMVKGDMSKLDEQNPNAIKEANHESSDDEEWGKKEVDELNKQESIIQKIEDVDIEKKEEE